MAPTNFRQMALVTVFLSSVNFCLAGEPPIVLEHRAEYDLRVGEPLRLICPVRGEPLPLVDWMKGERDLQRGAWEQRVRISGQALRIKESLSSDAGVYTCSATNGFGTVTVQFLVRVTSSKSSEPENASYIPKQSLDGSRRFVKEPEDEYSGSELLEINHRAVFIEPYPRNLSVNIGQNVSVVCRLGNSGKSPPSVKWYRLLKGLEAILLESVGPELRLTFKDDNLQQLTSGTELTAFTASATYQSVFHSTLTLTHVTLTHTGWYMCACRDTVEQFRSFFIHVTTEGHDNNDNRMNTLQRSTSVFYTRNTGMTFLIIIISMLIVFGLLLFVIVTGAICRRRKNRLRRSRDLLEKTLEGGLSLQPEMERIRVPARPGCEGMSAHCSPARQPGIGEWNQGTGAVLTNPGRSVESYPTLVSSPPSYPTLVSSPQPFNGTVSDQQYSVLYRTSGTDTTYNNKNLTQQLHPYTSISPSVGNTAAVANYVSTSEREAVLGGPQRYSGIYFEDNYTPLQNCTTQQRFGEQTLTYLADC